MHRYQLTTIGQAAVALAAACGWDLALAQRVVEGLGAVAAIPVIEEGRCSRCAPLEGLVRDFLEVEQHLASCSSSDPLLRQTMVGRLDRLREKIARVVGS